MKYISMPSNLGQSSSVKARKLITVMLATACGVVLTAGILGVFDALAVMPGSSPAAQIEKPGAVFSDTLYVGVNVPYWPFEYYSGTQLTGHDIDLMNAIAVEIGVPVEYITVPWEALFVGLMNYDYDAVISGLTPTPEREVFIDFTLPYMSVYAPLYAGDLGIAVRQGDVFQRSRINEALLSLRENGTLGTIIDETNVDISSVTTDTWVTLPDWPEVLSNTATTLSYTDTQGSETVIQIPGGAVSGAILLTYTPISTENVTSSFSIAGHVFDLDAYEAGAYLPDGYQFTRPITVTIHYTDADVAGLEEAALRLLTWEATSGNWEDAACGEYDRHPDENWLALPICHLSRFALFEVRYAVYLPSVSLDE